MRYTNTNVSITKFKTLLKSIWKFNGGKFKGATQSTSIFLFNWIRKKKDKKREPKMIDISLTCSPHSPHSNQTTIGMFIVTIYNFIEFRFNFKLTRSTRGRWNGNAMWCLMMCVRLCVWNWKRNCDGFWEIDWWDLLDRCGLLSVTVDE